MSEAAAGAADVPTAPPPIPWAEGAYVRLIADSVPALISYVGRDLRYRFLNKLYQEWFGASPEEVIGKSIEELLGREAFEQRRPHIEAALRGERRTFEATTPHKTLGVRDSEVTYVPDAGPDGAVRGFFVMVHDVTDRNRSRDELRRGHDLLDRIFDSAAVGLILSDHKGTILRANRAISEMLGYEPDEMLGRPLMENLALDDAEAARQRLAARLQGQQPPLRDWTAVRKDGGRRILRATASPIRSDEGGPLFVSVCYDVTEQREAERGVLETGKRLNSVLASITEGYIVLDETYRFVEVNPAASKMAFGGRRVEELIGRRFWEVYPEAEAGEFYEHYRRALKDRTPVHFEARSNISGRWFETHAYPGDGRLEIYIRDITPRKVAEEALAASEREFRAMFELSASGKAQADPATGRFLRVNKRFCEITGYSEEELLRLRFHDITHPDDLASTLRTVEPIMRGEADEWQSEKRYVRKDGSVVWVNVTGSTVRDAGGKPLRAIATVQDVTSRKRAEEAERRAMASLREANASLQESEARLARAQRIARVGDWEMDWVTKEVYWSDEMYRLMGVSPATFRPSVESFMAAVPKEDHGAIHLALDEALANCTAYAVDHRVVWPDGTVRVMSEQAEIVCDDGGKPLRLVGTMLDVTERKQAEQALREVNASLRESESRFRNMADNAPVVIWVTDPDGNCLYLNRQWCDLTGRSEEQSRGLGWLDAVHPDDRAAAGEAFLSSNARREPFRKEYRLRRHDGVYRWVIDSAVPRFGADGEYLGYIGSLTDITERIEADQAVRRSEERYRSLVAATTTIVWTADGAGAYVEPQPSWEAYTGQPWDKHRGFGWAQMLHPQDRDALTSAWMTAVGRRSRYEAHGRVWHAATATWRHFEVRAVPILEPGGTVREWVGNMVDVHDRREAELGLEEAKRDADAARAVAEAANKAKDQFLAVLSHELRTPLTPVVMTLAGLELDRSLSQDVRDDLAMIRRNVELETRLIDDLLDVTRITNGKLRLHLQPTDLHGLAETVVELFHSELRSKRVELRYDLNAPDARVSADPARLQQVLWNLVKNAIKFTPEGGRIIVRTNNPDPRTLEVSVIDTGVGIDPEALPRIFNAFEQAEQSVARQFGGLGLGLAISRALVELHGGTIRADSPGRDRGATFTVELPTVGAIERLVNQIQPPPQPAYANRPAVRLLLVEDHPDTLRVLKRLLEKMGYAVYTAASAAAALNVLATQSVDVLVSDIGLPDATGHELMRKIRADHGVLPGIAISGFGMDTDVRNSYDAGFLSHITKPVDVRQLDATIRTVLAERSAVEK
ncbi:MAG TPA: PAS domain S-box protein [Tepidisphaeraceae bacterium]|nr:PAS domain S-box protein [Tepidisphaeraceae bacterium]